MATLPFILFCVQHTPCCYEHCSSFPDKNAFAPPQRINIHLFFLFREILIQYQTKSWKLIRTSVFFTMVSNFFNTKKYMLKNWKKLKVNIFRKWTIFSTKKNQESFWVHVSEICCSLALDMFKSQLCNNWTKSLCILTEVSNVCSTTIRLDLS